MIILFNPRATKPRNRRFPLSVMALAAVLEGREEYEIVDGNVDENPTETILNLVRRNNVELLGVSVMPGPQMASAVANCKEIRLHCPKLPIVWGGYFASTYTDAALNARYVDYVVRGREKIHYSSYWMRFGEHAASKTSRDCLTRMYSACTATIRNGCLRRPTRFRGLPSIVCR